MLICDEPQFIARQPDFSSSEQASPQWTKLVCAGAELSNSINSVDWFGKPAVQVQLCEECGYAGCASGGYVHVSGLGKHLLWTPPHIDLDDPFESHQYRAADVVRKNGAVAIPAAEWDRWRERFTGLPSPEDFPRTTRRDLLAGWQAEADLFGVWDEPDHLLLVAHERAVAAEPSETTGALEGLDALVEWFGSEPGAAVEGELQRLAPDAHVVETLYFDVPDTFDRPVLREWAAFARRGDRITPVFGDELVLVPEPTGSGPPQTA
jgi:hypothetical protein